MNTISLIRSSWEFFRKQPALTSVAVWLLFLPMLIMDALEILTENDLIPSTIAVEASIGILVLTLMLTILTIWGQSSVLVAGRRMLQTKAGRSRTSFTATASEAKAFIIPLLLTSILYGCIIALWMLPAVAYVFALAYVDPAYLRNPVLVALTGLFTLPGMAAAVRMSFYPVIVVGENTAYRAALKRSKDAVRKGFWKITGQIGLLILFLLFIPMAIIIAAAASLPEGELIGYAIMSVTVNLWMALATVLLNLCFIRMYEQVRTPRKR